MKLGLDVCPLLWIKHFPEGGSPLVILRGVGNPYHMIIDKKVNETDNSRMPGTWSVTYLQISGVKVIKDETDNSKYTISLVDKYIRLCSC